MACEDFENQILDFLENQLPLSERTRVAAHLADCPGCRDFAQQLQDLDAQLARTMKVPTLSSSFNAKLRQRIQITPVMSVAEIAERKRQLQAEYEARKAELTLFARLPRKLFEIFGFAAMLALAGWIGWLIIPQSGIVFGATNLSPTTQGLVLLSLVATVPIGIGVIMTFPRQNKRLWSWLQPAGGGFSPVRFK